MIFAKGGKNFRHDNGLWPSKEPWNIKNIQYICGIKISLGQLGKQCIKGSLGGSNEKEVENHFPRGHVPQRCGGMSAVPSFILAAIQKITRCSLAVQWICKI